MSFCFRVIAKNNFKFNKIAKERKWKWKIREIEKRPNSRNIVSRFYKKITLAKVEIVFTSAKDYQGETFD